MCYCPLCGCYVPTNLRTPVKFKNNEEKYLFSREIFRQKSAKDFLNYQPKSKDLISCSNELVASLTLFTSGKIITKSDNAGYIADLIVSFCRTHFISVDLMLYGEIVESGVLIRKQIELLSRLQELTKGVDIEKLLKRTPNIKHIKSDLRKLYSDYCELAHSSTPSIMTLIGKSSVEESDLTPLYPEFQRN